MTPTGRGRRRVLTRFRGVIELLLFVLVNKDPIAAAGRVRAAHQPNTNIDCLYAPTFILGVAIWQFACLTVAVRRVSRHFPSAFCLQVGPLSASCCGPIVASGLSEHRQKRVLHDVVAGVDPAHVGGIAVNRALVSIEELRKRSLVASARTLEQPGIIHFTHVVPARWERFHNLFKRSTDTSA